MPKQKKIQKKENMDMIKKMSIIGAAGVLLILIVYGIISLTNKGADKDNQQQAHSPVDENENLENEVERLLGVIKEVDTDLGKLSVFDIEKNEKIELVMDGGVVIKDEYGTELTFAQLQNGDMIESKYDINKMRPEHVYKTAKTWERKNISEVHINTDENIIEIGNDRYDYTDELVTIYNEDSFDLNHINEVDEVTLRGYKNTVWAVIMQNRHGFITLCNHSSYIGGIMEVGTKKLIDIEETTTVTVPVGVHKLLITKEGMMPYSAEIMIVEDKEVEIDLSDSTPKVGLVNFIFSDEDVNLYINNESINTNEPVKLNYGKYTLRAEKEGFTKVEKELTISQAYLDYPIQLERIPLFLNVSRPKGAELYIDYNWSGIIPISVPITPGNHTLTLRQDNHYSVKYEITIDENNKNNSFLFPDLVPMDSGTTDGTSTYNENTYQENNTDINQEPEESDPTYQTPAEDAYGH